MLVLWLKAFHIIAVIAWMAALLYLPRLLVYHAESPPGSDKSETFKVMERRLLKAKVLLRRESLERCGQSHDLKA